MMYVAFSLSRCVTCVLDIFIATTIFDLLFSNPLKAAHSTFHAVRRSAVSDAVGVCFVIGPPVFGTVV